jgi:hypothetical protein
MPAAIASEAHLSKVPELESPTGNTTGADPRPSFFGAFFQRFRQLWSVINIEQTRQDASLYCWKGVLYHRRAHCILQSSPEPFMKILIFAGLLVVVLGIASFVVPIPRTETHGLKAGDVNIGVQTTHSERVSPIISVVLIAGGIVDVCRAAYPGRLGSKELRQT